MDGMSLKNSSDVNEPKQARNTVSGSTIQTIPRASTGPPSCYLCHSLTGTAERVTASDQVPAGGDGYSTTHNSSGDGSHSGVTSREETVLLKRGVCDRRRHRCGALDEEEKKCTAGRLSQISGTRHSFTRRYRVLSHGLR